MKKIFYLITALCLSITCDAQLQLSNNVKKTTLSQATVASEEVKSFVPVEFKGNTSTAQYITNPEIILIEKIEKSINDKEKNEKIITEISNKNVVISQQVNDLKNMVKANETSLGSANEQLSNFENELKNINDTQRTQLYDLITQQKSTISTLNDKQRKLTIKIITISDELTNNTIKIKELQQTNKLLSLENTELSEKILKNETTIKKLLETEKNYIILKYKTDSASINSFFKELQKLVSDVRKTLLVNEAAFSPDSYPIGSFIADSANLNNMWNDLTNLAAATAAEGIVLKHTLESPISEYLLLLNKLNDVSKLFELEDDISITKIDGIIAQRRKPILEAKDILEKKQKEFAATHEVYKNDFQKISGRLKTTMAIKKVTKQDDNASVFASLSSPLNESGLLVPGFELLAYNKFSDSTRGILGLARFIIGAPTSDSNKLNSATRLFVPEASNLGFMVDFTFGFDHANYISKQTMKAVSYHTLGINLGLYYLQKQLLSRDKENTPFTIGLIQTKVGLEKTIVKNGLAAFININGIYVGRGIENYSKHYDPGKKMQWFADAGLKSYLKLTKDEKTLLLMELRFIPVNSFIRSTTNSRDSFIPLIKIGFAKSFDF